MLLFSIRRISASSFACLLEKYGLEVYQNGLNLFHVLRLSKNPFLQRFFSLTTKSLYSFFDLGFIALIFNSEQFIIAECSVLLTWGLWFPPRLFFFFCAYLSKTSTKVLSKVEYSYELRDWVHLDSDLVQTENLYM